MATDERPSGDVLGEATALVQRVALRTASSETQYVLGLRREGCLSIYCDVEPVYQFNSHHQLRRVFWMGQRLTAQSGELVTLTKQHLGRKVDFAHNLLSSEKRVELLTELEGHLHELRRAIDFHQIEIMGQIPVNEEVITPIRAQLGQVKAPVEIAEAPHVR